jgi:hypothetical protein
VIYLFFPLSICERLPYQQSDMEEVRWWGIEDEIKLGKAKS